VLDGDMAGPTGGRPRVPDGGWIDAGSPQNRRRAREIDRPGPIGPVARNR
jgi:hypothetical protein